MKESAFQPEQHYAALIGLMARLVQAQAGTGIPAGQIWLNDRQTLAKKLIYHLRTIQCIAEGATLNVGEVQTHIVDHGSIKVLARAVWENYIVFAFIYGNVSSELCEFRHSCWRLSGLMDRQRRMAISAEGKMKLLSEKRLVQELTSYVKEHSFYKNLKNWQKKKIIQGDWRVGLQWNELAEQVGLNKRYFKNVYGYLCDYSHSSYAAAIQVRDAHSVEEELSIARFVFSSMNMVMAHFISTYSKLFDSATELLQKCPEWTSVQLWAFEPLLFEKIYSQSGLSGEAG